MTRFFRPTFGKVVWTIVFFGLSFIISIPIYAIDIGVPVRYYDAALSLPGLGAPKPPSWNIVNLVLDIIIWYILACLVLYLVHKPRKVDHQPPS